MGKLGEQMIKIVFIAGATITAIYIGQRHRKLQERKRREAKERHMNVPKSTSDSSPSLRPIRPRDSVTVRVPATTANLGPGFDTIGMAVDIWTEVSVKRSDRFSIESEGEGADVLPNDETNLVVVGLRAAFEAAGQSMPLLEIRCKNRIPFARGLGSSSAGIVAGIIAGE